jgi:hypothetical protein
MKEAAFPNKQRFALTLQKRPDPRFCGARLERRYPEEWQAGKT